MGKIIKVLCCTIRSIDVCFLSRIKIKNANNLVARLVSARNTQRPSVQSTVSSFDAAISAINDAASGR
eukprot:SAG31_NODE_12950_length_905_cov_0.894541_1_plen_67_part_10